jgi:hypothetical protein
MPKKETKLIVIVSPTTNPKSIQFPYCFVRVVPKDENVKDVPLPQ